MINKKTITQGERMARCLWIVRSPFENKQPALNKLQVVLERICSEGLKPWIQVSDSVVDKRGYFDTNMTFHLQNGKVYYNDCEVWAKEDKEAQIRYACVLGERGEVKNWLPINDFTPKQMIDILRSVSHYNFSFDKTRIEPYAPFLRFSYTERKKYARFEITPETGDIETYYHSGLNRLLPFARLKIDVEEGRRKGD